MKKAIYIIALLLTFNPVFGQSIKDELKAIRSAYIINKDFSFDVEAYSYATKNDKVPDLISKGTAKKTADKYYSKFDQLELLVNGDRTLMIDNAAGKMALYSYSSKLPKDYQDFRASIDTLLALSDSVVARVSTVKGEKHFTSFSKTGFVKQTEIYFDEKTHFINRLVYQYVSSTAEYELEADRVEVFYKNIAMKPTGTEFFELERFLKNENSKFIPVGKYRGYSVNHYTSKS
jgi:hypothetical protein